MVDQGSRNPPGRPARALNYSGLVGGPNWTRQFQGGRSITLDGTKARLRSSDRGSPFTFRMMPPDLLLESLVGRGNPSPPTLFDDLLSKQRALVEESIPAGATDAELADALAGTRAPVDQASNIGIIDAALRSSNKWSQVRNRRQRFKDSKFYATGDDRQRILSKIDRQIAANGISFDPQNAESTGANQPAKADINQALDVLVQLNRMINTPALTLLVNPQSLTINYAKKQQYNDRSRYNYIFQAWGEEQVRLQVAGKTGGFVVGSKGFDEQSFLRRDETPPLDPHNPIRTENISGYQWVSKRDSAAWQNLMSLFSIYRNNGYIYNRLDESEAHLWVGNIQISYDQMVYLGQFENFEYQYSEEKQHGVIDFSFDFVVSFMYDMAQRGKVKPIPSVTPSPSDPSWVSSRSSGTSPLPNSPDNATRDIPPNPQQTQSSTTLFDPVANPPGDPTLEEILGPNFQGTIRFPSGETP